MTKKIVAKIGTHLITTEDGKLNLDLISHIVEQINQLMKRGFSVVLVTSGSVAAGKNSVTLPSSNPVIQRQVFSSVGQIKLMETYKNLFQKKSLACGQILASKGDFRDRRHFLNMKKCLESLLEFKIVPIVNENDSVSVTELMFTDNDELTGLISAMLNVDRTILLTNVDGIYNSDGEVIPTVNPRKDKISQYIYPTKSTFGRGGMHTKCRVGEKLSKIGITTSIANGNTENILVKIVENKQIGTQFLPNKKVSSIKKWISQTEGYQKGIVYINEGAEILLPAKDKARSLLPVGIIKMEGLFQKGDILQVKNSSGKHLGIGIAQYSSDKLKSCIGKKGEKPLIHYNYLYLE